MYEFTFFGDSQTIAHMQMRYDITESSEIRYTHEGENGNFLPYFEISKSSHTVLLGHFFKIKVASFRYISPYPSKKN